MRKQIAVAVLLASVCAPVALSAQPTRDWRGLGSNYTLTSWTEKDGLAIVWSIAQDQQGVIWLGTASGLVRFDGARFVPWTPQSQHRLSSTIIPALCAARDGSLWVALSGPTRVLRIHANEFVEYGLRDALQISNVLALLESQDGTIWAGGRGGLARFRNEKWEVVPWPVGAGEPYVESLFEDHSKTLWIGTSHGVFRRSTATGSIVAVPQTSDLDVKGITEDGLERILITGPAHGVRVFNESGELNQTAAYLPAAGGERLLNDASGTIWIATPGSGLFRVDHEGQSPEIEQFTSRDGLAGNVVRAVFEDRDGAIWAGTLDGLTRVSKADITTIVGRNQTAEETAVGAVTVARDSSVWGAVGNDLIQFSVDGRTSRPSAGLDTGKIAIEALYADPRGGVWIGSNRGLSSYVDGKVTAIALPNISLKRVRAITADAKGGLWIADQYAGLLRWHEGRVTSFKDFQGQDNNCLYTDRHGRVWIGNTEGDLAVYEEGQFRWYTEKNGLGGGSVLAVSEDTQGAVWVTTAGGISKFSGESPTVVPISQLDGNPLRWMVLDRDDRLWLGTVLGIVRFEQSEFAKAASDPSYRPLYRFFDASDGLKGSPIHIGNPSATRSSDGLLWFLTTSGLSVLNTAQLTPVHHAPAIHIDGLTADGSRLERSDGAALSPHTSRLQLDYSAIAFGSQGKLHFRYMLDGFEGKWVDNGIDRAARFTNLSPGRYQFRVQARYDDGDWGEPGATFRFSIEPAFYQTYWFYAASISAMILLGWTGWQARVRHMRKQFALVLKERARLGREIHDTLLQTLSGTALQLDNIALEEGPQASIRSRLQRIRHQLEDSIDDANHSIRNLRAPEISSDQMPATLERSIRDLLNNTTILLRFDIKGAPRACAPAAWQQLRRIALEAVTNAIRHGHPTQIDVGLVFEDEFVQLTVSDDGCGFDVERSAPDDAHWGLVIMSERAQQVGGRVSISSTVGGGARVAASIPYSKPK